MQVAYWIVVLAIIEGTTANIYTESESNQNLVECVTHIINKHYKRREVTYVDLHYDDADIIKVNNSLPVTVVSRDSVRNFDLSNTEYVITASNTVDFSMYFPNLPKEPFWNPTAMFLIIIKRFAKEDLNIVFDVLLKYHVVYAVVVNGTNDADSFIYNPFENYNCGKKYDGIIKLGRCPSSRIIDYYPPKLVTGLRKCKFNVMVAYWPPFTFYPVSSKRSPVGVEQFVFTILSELEHFDINYMGNVSDTDFSMVSPDMTVSGSLSLLQESKTDIMFGALLLLHSRANAFDVIYEHLPFKDDVRVLVHVAETVPMWKYFYLEFEGIVWLLFIVTFTCYFLFMAAIFRVKDKVALLLAMWDILFQHGSRRITKWRVVFIHWIVFAYLFSTYYQSSLVSITTRSVKNYQVSTEDDLQDFGIEPCVSMVVESFMSGVRQDKTEVDYKDGCYNSIDSIRTVSKSNNKYTISFNYDYLYNRHLFVNEQNDVPIFSFKNPMYRVIYAYYLYKGFPMRNSLNINAIRLRENGLIDKYTEKLFEDRWRKNTKKLIGINSEQKKFLIPWYIFYTGLVASTLVFIAEFFYFIKSVNKVYRSRQPVSGQQR